MEGTLTGWLQDFMGFVGYDPGSSVYESLSEFDVYTIILVGALAVVIGALQSFLGFKSFKVWCAFIGLVLGAIGGFALAAPLVPMDVSEYSEVIRIFFVVCFGILGAFIAYRAYAIGAFLYAFAAVFALCYFPLSPIIDPSFIAVIIGLCAGIAAGVVSVIYLRISIISATSILGGLLVAFGLMLLLEGNAVFLATILPIILAVACMVGGFFVQLKTTEKKPVKVAVVPGGQGEAGTTPVVAVTGSAQSEQTAAQQPPAAAPDTPKTE